MSTKLLFLVTSIFACGSLVSCFIGWNYPLATTWRYRFNGQVALGIVLVTEFVWFLTNIYAIQILRAAWKVPADLATKTIAFVIAVSFPAQVFLGHSAIRDLLKFVRDG